MASVSPLPYQNAEQLAAAAAPSAYIDSKALLDPGFHPASYVNACVLRANDPADTTPIDLATPLARVLFDAQEIDTRLDATATRHAASLLAHSQTRSQAAGAVLRAAQARVDACAEAYRRLEKDVVQRHGEAEENRRAAARVWVTVKIGRAVNRALALGRQLETQMRAVPATSSTGLPAGVHNHLASPNREREKDDPTAMMRAAHTLLTLRALLAASGPGEEGEHLTRIHVIGTLRSDLMGPAETRLRTRAQQLVREFTLSPLSSNANASTTSPPSTPPAPASPALLPATTTSTSTSSGGAASSSSSSGSNLSYTQLTPETRQRTIAALQTLYLLSPSVLPLPSLPGTTATFTPTLLLAALQSYLQAALSSSLAAISRALAALPTFPRALAETSARCRNLVALERLLARAPIPSHPALSPSSAMPSNPPSPTQSSSSSSDLDSTDDEDDTRKQTRNRTSRHTDRKATRVPPSATSASSSSTLLPALLQHLDTSSLPSYFWRSLASSLSPRVRDILARGGVGARQLRAARERIRTSLRDAVLKGCEGADARDDLESDSLPTPNAAGKYSAQNADGKSEGTSARGSTRAASEGWEREVGVMIGSVVGVMDR